MAQRKELTEAQVALLRWVNEGCPDGVYEGTDHRISVAALRSRGFVTTFGRGPTWTTAITVAGKTELERWDSDTPPIPRAPSGLVSDSLVQELQAAGGRLVLSNGRRAQNWSERVRRAERHGRVPPGQRLVLTRTWETLTIELAKAIEGTERPLLPVPVPERVRAYHRVAARFRDQAERHEVSRAALPRAVRIVHALLAEAGRRGYSVDLAPDHVERDGRKMWTGPQQGHILISIGNCIHAVRVSEAGLGSRSSWERSHPGHRPFSKQALAARRAEYEAGATGRLVLEIVTAQYLTARQLKWSDRRAWTVEDKLPEVLRELEVLAAEQVHREQEAKRQAALRKQQWHEAMDRARQRYRDHQLGQALEAQATRWRTAADMRAYCAAVLEAYADDDVASDWARWGLVYAEQIDPLQSAPHPPPIPADVPNKDLQPFLDASWNALGPSVR